MKFFHAVFLVMMLSGISISATAQPNTHKKTDSLILVPAGAEYLTSPSQQKWWGTNYRKEWGTPVRLPVAMLETFHGGLKPVKAGGGHQTKSLRVEDKNGKVYTLRSVNKTLGKVLPDPFLGTFLEDLVNDKVSMSYPYAAPAVAYLAEHAGVYHTNPIFVYMPKQPALDSFPNFGNAVYLFEQKLDGDWTNADNIGNFSEYKGTFKIIDSMLATNEYRADQKQFVKSRLFDMMINDWDRHEDQWEWGLRKKDDKWMYVPVPQDRDQAFFSYNGILLSAALKASGMSYFQPFDETIKDVKTLNFEQRNLDRFFSNELTLADWQQIAKDLQHALTDDVIAASISTLPPEIRDISGPAIIKDIAGRRDRLADYAMIYYKFLAKEVDIPASRQNEHFKVTRNGDQTTVNIFNADSKPFYSRTFNKGETNEIRLYGIDGNDRFDVDGQSNDIKVRLIGGNSIDTINVEDGGVSIYDDKRGSIHADHARTHLSKNPAIHRYNYSSYTYDKSGIVPTFYYNNDDYFFVGLGYKTTKHKWRREPFAYTHYFGVNYSLSQSAFSVNYSGLVPNFVGKWALALAGKWDAIRWTQFWGLGNETRFIENTVDYYRARSEQWYGSAGLQRTFGHFAVQVNGVYQRIRVINDENRFTGKNLVPFIPGVTDEKQFGGAELYYRLHQLNDSVIPTKGYIFFGKASYLQNLTTSTRHVTDLQANLNLFVPLISKFSLVVSGGAETVEGKPEFYQYAAIGGSQTFRGSRFTRFWGKTAVYNNNELRFMTDLRSHMYNGKVGLLAFHDEGRVWMPGETSSTLHTAWGLGFLLAPFNKLYGEVTYNFTGDEKLLLLRLTTPIK